MTTLLLLLAEHDEEGMDIRVEEEDWVGAWGSSALTWGAATVTPWSTRAPG